MTPKKSHPTGGFSFFFGAIPNSGFLLSSPSQIRFFSPPIANMLPYPFKAHLSSLQSPPPPLPPHFWRAFCFASASWPRASRLSPAVPGAALRDLRDPAGHGRLLLLHRLHHRHSDLPAVHPGGAEKRSKRSAQKRSAHSREGGFQVGGRKCTQGQRSNLSGVPKIFK